MSRRGKGSALLSGCSPVMARVVLVWVFYSLAYSTASPMVPQRVIELLGGDLSGATAVTGGLAACNALAALFVAAPAGALSDRVGRKALVVSSLSVSLLDAVVCALSPVIWPMFVSRTLAGILAPIYPSVFSMLADVSTPANRTVSFAWVLVGFGFSFSFMPLVMGFVAKRWGFQVPLLIAGALYGLGLVFTIFFLPETHPLEKRIAARQDKLDWCSILNPFRSIGIIWRIPFSRGLAILYFLIFIVEEGVMDTFLVFIKAEYGWGPVLIGVAMSFLGVMMVIVQGGVTRLVVPWIGEKRTLMLCLVVDFVSIPFYALVVNTYALFGLFAFRSLALMAGPTIQGMISCQFSEDDQGTVLGTISALKALTSFVGPLVFNSLLTYFTSKEAPIYLPGIVMYSACVDFFICAILYAGIWWKWGTGMRDLFDKRKHPLPEDDQDAGAVNADPESRALLGEDGVTSVQ